MERLRATPWLQSYGCPEVTAANETVETYHSCLNHAVSLQHGLAIEASRATLTDLATRRCGLHFKVMVTRVRRAAPGAH